MSAEGVGLVLTTPPFPYMEVAVGVACYNHTHTYRIWSSPQWAGLVFDHAPFHEWLLLRGGASLGHAPIALYGKRV